ncbi:hypothetical protein [Bradyrhizobium elkanii]|nr:hypothetical protein [Bradyrhizobium elkanii]MCW2110064.1 hypothetical protein [Bradyrhizobium elkanii]MCW2201564.1 hypothetical protein [Bradyrhizobium elkanii]WLB76240.1 hypothetical protein QIH89_21075 [Bradyrhizobium elkanii]
MMKPIFRSLPLLFFGIVTAHAVDVVTISEQQMRAQIEQGHCPADLTHVQQTTERTHGCQALCGAASAKLYNCSPGADDFVGYEPECIKEVNRLNELINQYNQHLDNCKAADKRGSRQPASTGSGYTPPATGSGSSRPSSSARQQKTKTDALGGPITESGRVSKGSHNPGQEPKQGGRNCGRSYTQCSENCGKTPNYLTACRAEFASDVARRTTSALYDCMQRVDKRWDASHKPQFDACMDRCLCNSR